MSDNRARKVLAPHPGFIRPVRGAARIAGIYGAVGIAWIVLSDRLVTTLAGNTQYLSELQTYKGFAFVLVTTAVLFAITYGHLKKLSQAAAERERLLQEVHHRVGNNLQLIYGLFNLQTSTDAPAEYTLARLRDQISTIALANKHVFAELGEQETSAEEFVRTMTTAAIRSCSERARITDVHTNVSCSHVQDAWLVTLGLILNELTNNACRHAYSQDQSGPVSICLTQRATEYELRVTDQGRGYPESVTAEHQYRLGLTLVSVLAKQLNGSMEVVNQTATPGGAAAIVRWSDT